MTSRSARVATERPFYDRHADAYDALITDPVEPWVEAVHERLQGAGITRASILDAGCGTGRHGEALAALGHRVTLLDASPALLAVASRRCPNARILRADLCRLEADETYDAVVCRGVLNDLVEDAERAAALSSLAKITGQDGFLILDVREREASALRADAEWRAKTVELAGGERLTFSSRPTWHGGRIEVEERYELRSADGRPIAVHEYSFAMVPWTRAELQEGLSRVGFTRVEVRPGVGRRSPDRILVVARR
ncbi:class I SAM-dependent DNA methyltransferase [Microlunatus sp. GCM10028923]|uniref:class I SAM-dependent DNA methyltransferase n=1 Tax=Microlunatus sp. GCM10028923 TaxID=3273400 RepID=UPI0036216CF1